MNLLNLLKVIFLFIFIHCFSASSMENVDPNQSHVKSEAEIGKILINGRLVPTLANCLCQSEKCGLDLIKINERQRALRLDSIEDPAIDIINLQKSFIELANKEKTIVNINNSLKQAQVLLNNLANANSKKTYDSSLICFEQTFNHFKNDVVNGCSTTPVINERIIGLKDAIERTRSKIIKIFGENKLQITAEQLNLLSECIFIAPEKEEETTPEKKLSKKWSF